MRTTFFLFLCLAGTLGGAAEAGQTVYDCTLRSNEKYGWIPAQMVFLVDDVTGRVSVNDPVIDHVVGKPVQAVVSSRDKGRYKLKWTLEDLPSRRNGSTRGQYSATLDTRKSYVRARASLSGFDNRPSGQGACTATRLK